MTSHFGNGCEPKKKKYLIINIILDQLIVSAYIILEIFRIKCAYFTTQFNFKLYILNLFDSSSAVKAYKNTLQQSHVQEFKKLACAH